MTDSCAPLSFDRAGIMTLIPHRDPMLLLERIAWLEAGPRSVAVGVAADLASRAPAIARGPGEVPPELLVEGIAQTAAALLVAEGVAAGRYPAGAPQPGVLGGLRDVRLGGRVAAGEPVTFRVAVERRLGALVLVRGEAFAGARLAASGTISISLGMPG
jgi:3-hydroxymyristoyl/3-hydroxydecanoyl-(acyl carrier protein) dehydratase